ncbi:GTP 3',8-cyclase MoaA [Fusibacter paucivorans]|uniref:GTP 3',8-cyclase n=1 Tax=Fusibacter paucivorans TaxID=76009 RepID=A0ABS5PL43_9FIRM|nr:GTP 3',8-cyclase MoaA [Fusibacter paucivorans]MBS7525894.1 GTP 3',8-cyclase MoaA [Fusibacter paucivorans]
MKDQFGRQVKYLRLSVTDRCNLRCQYCMPAFGIEKLPHQAILSMEALGKLADTFIDLGVEKIRLTGGEPLVRKGILNLVEHIGANPKVTDFAMTTNGILLSKYADDLKAAGLKRVNISLDTLDSKKYAKITRGGDLGLVLNGIDAAKRVGLTPIKLNVVLIGGFNENEIERFVMMTRDEAIDVRFIELMPIGEVANWSTAQFLPNDTVLKRVPALAAVPASDPASPAKYYQLPNAKGRVGLISPISCKFCADCNRVRLTAEGKLKYCLHADEEVDLTPYLEDEAALRDVIAHYILEKPEAHQIGSSESVKRNMFQVGG